jgi:hypothetical protein
MPKLKGTQDLPNESTPAVSKPNPWSGPWGKINPSPQTAQTLRLCKRVSSSAEESFSYPYRSLASWQWRRELQEEELKIEAGPDAITLRGKGLSRLVDALDTGALEIVRESSIGAASSVEDTIVVQSLIIEKTRQFQSSTGAETEGRRVRAE